MRPCPVGHRQRPRVHFLAELLLNFVDEAVGPVDALDISLALEVSEVGEGLARADEDVEPLEFAEQFGADLPDVRGAGPLQDREDLPGALLVVGDDLVGSPGRVPDPTFRRTRIAPLA